MEGMRFFETIRLDRISVFRSERGSVCARAVERADWAECFWEVEPD